LNILFEFQNHICSQPVHGQREPRRFV